MSLKKFTNSTKVEFKGDTISVKNRDEIKKACAEAMVRYRDMFGGSPVLGAYFVEYKLSDNKKITMNLIDLRYMYEDSIIYALFKEV